MSDDNMLPETEEPLGSAAMRKIVADVNRNQKLSVSERLQKSKVFRADGSRVPAPSLPIKRNGK